MLQKAPNFAKSIELNVWLSDNRKTIKFLKWVHFYRFRKYLAVIQAFYRQNFRLEPTLSIDFPHNALLIMKWKHAHALPSGRKSKFFQFPWRASLSSILLCTPKPDSFNTNSVHVGSTAACHVGQTQNSNANVVGSSRSGLGGTRLKWDTLQIISSKVWWIQSDFLSI